MNLDKKYQVFVSSTYIDLQEERQEVIKALLELDCFPSSMEFFPFSAKSIGKGNSEKYQNLFITNAY